MATIATLHARSELIRIGGGLDRDEQPLRLLYAFPHVVTWFRDILPTLKPDLSGGVQNPLEQVDFLLHEFVIGEDFSYYERCHCMMPGASGVWELKTPDVRLFGWFNSKCSFVIANADSAFRCKNHDLYEGYKTDTMYRRNNLDLDEPKFIEGEYGDVF